GTIKTAKDSTVTLAVRIRDPGEGVFLDPPLDTTATNVEAIGHAAEELSTKLRDRLATALAPKPIDKHAPPPTAPPPPAKQVLAAITGAEPLRGALETAFVPWAQHRHHEMTPVKPGVPMHAFAIWCDVQSYSVEPGTIPFGRAHV